MKEKADTYRKICQTLLELHDAADSIFNVITTRVGLEHQRLQELSTRIQATQAKVEALSGTKRATKLYASAKYPKIPPDAIDFTPLFGGNGDGHHRELPAATLFLNLGHGKLDEEEGTLELFRFFSETNHEYWPREHRSSVKLPHHYLVP
jgi:WAS family protein 1